MLNEAGGRIAFRFRARDVQLVLRSRAGTAVLIRALVDGEAPSAAHGARRRRGGPGDAGPATAHQLVCEPGRLWTARFSIAFLDAGVEAYVFTRSDLG